MLQGPSGCATCASWLAQGFKSCFTVTVFCCLQGLVHRQNTKGDASRINWVVSCLCLHGFPLRSARKAASQQLILLLLVIQPLVIHFFFSQLFFWTWEDLVSWSNNSYSCWTEEFQMQQLVHYLLSPLLCCRGRCSLQVSLEGSLDTGGAVAWYLGQFSYCWIDSWTVVRGVWPSHSFRNPLCS